MTATKAMKRCVTCEYWTGERRVIRNGKAVEYKSNTMQGTCLHKQRSHTILYRAFDCCPKYQTWAVLQ